MDKNKEARRDLIDPYELWLLLRGNHRVVAAAALGVLAAVVVGTLAAGMQFRARGSLYLGELQTGAPAGAQPAPDRWDFAGGASGDVGTEIEILKSQELIKRAVFESGLNVTLAPAGWKPPRYLAWRLARRDPNLIDGAAAHLLATRAAPRDRSIDRRALSVRFVAAGLYEIWDGGESWGRGSLGQEVDLGGLTITLLAGPAGAPAVGEVYALRVRSADEVADEVGKLVNVTVPKATPAGDPVKVVSVDFLDPSPRAAARFVAALLQAYLDRRQSWKTEEATRAESFVTDQVASMRAALDEAERELADYKKSSNVVALSDEAKGMVDQIGKYEEQRVASRLQVASFAQIQELLKRSNAPIEQFLVGEGDDQVLAGLSNNLAQAQQELRRIEERFTPDAPAAREQQAQVDGQLRVVKNYVVGRYTRAQKQLDSVNQMIAQFEKKLKTVPGAQLDLARLARRTEVLSKMYSFLLERQQQAGVTKASTISRNRILDNPEPPRREDSPAAIFRLLAGALLGLLLGTAFVVLRRLLAPTFESETELRRALGQVPVLATVPASELSVGGSPPGSASPFAEAFRHLRTNLYCADPSRAERVVLVTSPSPNDGKTVCTFALASALASDGRRVLVIAGDMRRTAAGSAGVPPRGTTGALQLVGLSEILRRRSHWTGVVRSLPSVCGTVDLIPAGECPPSPAELLSSEEFRALLAEVRASYEMVLIDSPPFPLVSDALIMAMNADRVLTVLRPHNTHRRPVEEHLQRLAALGLPHGVVLNGVDAMSSGWERDYAQAYAAQPAMVRDPGGRLGAPA
ncbi:MAG TPA: GNVR domain-containing protein [Polyangia bacterium]|nr:GNVR domain-containing protein [Polyangia bacterium]